MSLASYFSHLWTELKSLLTFGLDLSKDNIVSTALSWILDSVVS